MSAATVRTEKIEKLKRMQAEYTTLMTEAQIHEKSVKVWSLAVEHGMNTTTLSGVHNACNVSESAKAFDDCATKMIKLNREMYLLGEELRE